MPHSSYHLNISICKSFTPIRGSFSGFVSLFFFWPSSSFTLLLLFLLLLAIGILFEFLINTCTEYYIMYECCYNIYDIICVVSAQKLTDSLYVCQCYEIHPTAHDECAVCCVAFRFVFVLVPNCI